MSHIIPFVIAAPYRQRQAVDRLIKYCRDLDGTEIIVIPISQEEDDIGTQRYPRNTFCCLQAMALRKAAIQMKGSPWGWLEHDSIPIKPGWAKILTDEYKRLGKPFMLSSDSHPPGDLIGGIGIFSGNTHEIIPVEIESHGWDMWMIKNIPYKISRTHLIQHKYAEYPEGSMHKSRDLEFPRDQNLIREDTVIFHRDATQSLIPRKELTFWMSGDLGDIIASMAVVRQLGGGHLYIGNHPKYAERGWRQMKGQPYEVISPLLEKMPYIKSIRYDEYSNGHDYDFSEWRNVYDRYRSLAHNQAAYLGVQDLNTSPWIEVDPNPNMKGKIVISRSSRYHNQSFPWIDIGQRYRNNIVFVGHPEEHISLQKHMGCTFPHMQTKNMLEVAELISGCELMIANQSSPGWLALAMGKKLIQESYIHSPDSKIDRPQNQYADSAYFNWPKL
jgi:hypothetical protein